MTTPRLTRRQWGAIDVPASRPTRIPGTLGCAPHWVGPRVWPTSGVQDHAQCAAKVRGIQRTHMAGEWYDIAYNEVVCPHGTRYEGRGHNVQTGANGSAEGNRTHYAILALVGKGDPQPAALLEGIRDAVADYRLRAGAGTKDSTHRDLLRTHTTRTTECPGDVLYGLTRAGRFTPITAPPTTTTPWKGSTMKPVLVKVAGTAPVYLSADRVQRRWVKDPKDLATVRADMAAVGASTTIREVTAAQIGHYGVLVGPKPEGVTA